MSELKRYKWPIIALISTIVVLMLMIAIGYTIGILSEDPDGLEKTLLSYYDEEWLENLPSPWVPWLSWITNDYIAGLLGVVLTAIILVVIFYGIIYLKKKRSKTALENS